MQCGKRLGLRSGDHVSVPALLQGATRSFSPVSVFLFILALDQIIGFKAFLWLEYLYYCIYNPIPRYIEQVRLKPVFLGELRVEGYVACFGCLPPYSLTLQISVHFTDFPPPANVFFFF